MATIDMKAISESLAKLFESEIVKSFNRPSSILKTFFESQEVSRTCAEEESDQPFPSRAQVLYAGESWDQEAGIVTVKVQLEPTLEQIKIDWDLSFS